MVMNWYDLGDLLGSLSGKLRHALCKRWRVDCICIYIVTLWICRTTYFFIRKCISLWYTLMVILHVHVLIMDIDFLHVIEACHAGPIFIQVYKTSLWPQMPQRQVGGEPPVTIMVFHVQCSIFPWKYSTFLPNFIEILSKADDTPNCRLLSAIRNSMLIVGIYFLSQHSMCRFMCVMTKHYDSVGKERDIEINIGI